MLRRRQAGAPWRTHSCVPRSHSCERLGIRQNGVRMSANTARLGACATRGTGVFNRVLPATVTCWPIVTLPAGRGSVCGERFCAEKGLREEVFARVGCGAQSAISW